MIRRRRRVPLSAIMHLCKLCCLHLAYSFALAYNSLTHSLFHSSTVRSFTGVVVVLLLLHCLSMP